MIGPSEQYLPFRIPLDADLQALYRRCKAEIAERAVETWLRTATLPRGLSPEGLREEFQKANPTGPDVPIHIFQRIRWADDEFSDLQCVRDTVDTCTDLR